MEIKLSRRSIILDIILTLVTFGIWNLIVQIRQIIDVNSFLAGDDKVRSAAMTFFLSIITLGLYFVYHEYVLTKKLHILLYGERKTEVEYLMGLLTFIGVWFIVDSYQQNLLNLYADKFEVRSIEQQA